MTTNQTIGGVPRELAESIVRMLQAGGARDTAEQLRALLDVSLTDEGECCHEFVPFQPDCTKCGIPYKPAAQPQDEPVAWMDPRSPEMHATISNEVKQHNLKFGGAPSAAVNGYSIPLYAEQPAPVAVVSGGRQAGKSHLAAQLESLAKQVYQSWESQPGFVPWVDGGNSTKQDEARQIASRVFELALANQVGD